MKKTVPVEREFGVPIPGVVLEPAQWARTALKKLPEQGPLDFTELFGRPAPLVVDLGCGNGRFLIGSALRRPDFDHIGVDILPLVLRYATRRGNQRGLMNLRFAAVDAQRFVVAFLPVASVCEIHCYHPQPHHQRHAIHKRLLKPEFLAQTHSALIGGGKFFVQTDNAAYWKYLKDVLPAFFDFHEQAGPWPEDPKGRTRREILALKRGYPIHRGWGMRKEIADAAVLATQLPQPTFDAGPRLKDIDQLEQGR